MTNVKKNNKRNKLKSTFRKKNKNLRTSSIKNNKSKYKKVIESLKEIGLKDFSKLKFKDYFFKHKKFMNIITHDELFKKISN